ncbi:MAG TPA: putative glycoside hydrolase [Spirochaetota bacterium]|nr:hypothetical protein [Spirochaetota bacterium]HOD14271.1 putative glycoside hydrolase [Spirochaetota bacterium]HPG50596.1 putative glycoside hydrolase [Spirochaetota bacterium]HPN12197.1 putative glycoside hydrolase [Spirochaetota bacterium]
MNTYTRQIIVAVFAAATLSLGVAVNYRAILTGRDYLIGSYLETAEVLFPYGEGSLTIVDHARYRGWLHTYRDLPRGFFRAGGMLLYRAGGDTGAGEIAEEAVRYTEYLRASRLAGDIREYNGLKNGDVPAGTAVLVPNALPGLLTDVKNRSLPPLITARGLYFTGTSVGSGMILKNLERYRALGINTIVFDAKDIGGDLTYRSRVPAAVRYGTNEKCSIDNLEKFVRILKENGFYTVARLAVFHDHLLRKKDPSLAIRTAGGGAWNPGSKEKWCDPTSRKVQDYNIDLSLELADAGVDEIQFDYIRFPTGSSTRDAAFSYDFGRMSKDEAITRFLERAHRSIRARNARLSIDIFGVVAWGKAVDISSTGQRIELLARHCDIISPMLYPSHFNDDFDGYARPGDNPYYFIYEGCRKVLALAGRNALVRPWLQAFRWRVSNYNGQYIMTQVKATNDSGAKGYLFWNASNDYDTVLGALERMNGSGAAKSREGE